MTKKNKKGHAGLIIFILILFSPLAEAQDSISISASSHAKQWNNFLTA